MARCAWLGGSPAAATATAPLSGFSTPHRAPNVPHELRVLRGRGHTRGASVSAPASHVRARRTRARLGLPPNARLLRRESLSHSLVRRRRVSDEVAEAATGAIGLVTVRATQVDYCHTRETKRWPANNPPNAADHQSAAAGDLAES